MSRKSITMRTTAISATALIALGALSACSSDSTDGEASVGGMTTCDEATISASVDDVLATEGQGNKLFSLDGLECADGWAVAFPTVGPEEGNAVTITTIFEAEGQFWVLKDPTEVCGTYNMDDSAAYPSDALIPESLYQAGCQTN
jgi:hypothetical protein